MTSASGHGSCSAASDLGKRLLCLCHDHPVTPPEVDAKLSVILPAPAAAEGSARHLVERAGTKVPIAASQ
jgi:hypothetical protein